MQQNAAFDVLTKMRDAAVALAAETRSITTQSAGVKYIAFQVNDVYFFCDAQEVREVSVCENLMAVPQTKRWMRGLINSKGVLYSVTDIALLAGFDRAVPANRGHLLLLNDLSLQSALLVNRVVGFRYFDDAQKIDDLEQNAETLGGLSDFVDVGLQTEDHSWFRLDIAALLASEQFREIQ